MKSYVMDQTLVYSIEHKLMSYLRHSLSGTVLVHSSGLSVPQRKKLKKSALFIVGKHEQLMPYSIAPQRSRQIRRMLTAGFKLLPLQELNYD